MIVEILVLRASKIFHEGVALKHEVLPAKTARVFKYVCLAAVSYCILHRCSTTLFLLDVSVGKPHIGASA